MKEFYRLNHAHQTSTSSARRKPIPDARPASDGVWEALEYLNTLVDDSDPDIDLTQIEHALQTAEAIGARTSRAGSSSTGLIHDLGKILCLLGEPQWAVVGDTFPVGCAVLTTRSSTPSSSTRTPIARIRSTRRRSGSTRSIGLDNVHLSWGHDEYIYHVVKDHLPVEALYALRYHSFYPWHKEGAYDHLANEQDREMLKWVKAFNRYDLYSKGDGQPDARRCGPTTKIDRGVLSRAAPVLTLSLKAPEQLQTSALRCQLHGTAPTATPLEQNSSSAFVTVVL